MTYEAVVFAEDLSKEFGSIRAVDGISFYVREGECYGFLGPNGAGKTTAIRMIYCRTPVTSGVLKVFGLDVRRYGREIKSMVGVAPQENNLDPDLDVIENLLVYSRYYDIPKKVARERAMELLRFLSIDERRKEQVTKLSGGMQRRLVIARALINNPRLLVLDEPTTGLDPQARHLIWQRIRELKRQGVTMILTTHYMEEAEQLCDRVAVMDLGKILVEGPPRELIERYAGKDVFEIRRVEDEGFLKALRGLEFSFEKAGDTIYIYSNNGDEIGRRLFSIKDIEVLHRRSNLEDVFLKLTGKELRD
ncbi:Daunorubicin/doxorubicin resistance ATP-binding protein DrrA [bacterium HR37]|nr:Daunorubicin/doxorubicin resistance ATP-binding protein DrrA [bacterium HR37]